MKKIEMPNQLVFSCSNIIQMHYLCFGRKCNEIIVRNKQNIIVKVSQVIIQINISQVEPFYAVWTENFHIWLDRLNQTFF